MSEQHTVPPVGTNPSSTSQGSTQGSAAKAPRVLPDIETRDDVTKFVRAFYIRVAHDDLLGPIFVDLAKVDWDLHIPKLVDFWQMIEFRIRGFAGSPIQKHIQFSALEPFTAEHFERWVTLFHDTIDRLAAGPHAESIKAKAVMIAIAQSHATPTAENWNGLGSV